VPRNQPIIVDQTLEIAFERIVAKKHNFPNYLGKGLKIFPDQLLLTDPEKRKASEYKAYSEA